MSVFFLSKYWKEHRTAAKAYLLNGKADLLSDKLANSQGVQVCDSTVMFIQLSSVAFLCQGPWPKFHSCSALHWVDPTEPPSLSQRLVALCQTYGVVKEHRLWKIWRANNGEWLKVKYSMGCNQTVFSSSKLVCSVRWWCSSLGTISSWIIGNLLSTTIVSSSV